MDSWHSYPKINNIGHRLVKDVLLDEVTVEEKVDGSQFSFGRFGDETRAKSKGAPVYLDAPNSMFSNAAKTVRELAPQLHDGWTYRGEYLSKPKHNALAYDRIPAKHVIIFDINTAQETYLSHEEKAAEAARLGLEVVPLIFRGVISGIDVFRSFLDTASVLGGQKIEGVVIKNYNRFLDDGKCMFAKFVSEAFKEVHAAEWKESNPAQGAILDRIVDRLRTPARWNKAIQHMAEAGKLDYSPKDIGHLIREAQNDTKEECESEVKDWLFSWAWPQISRQVIHGLPEHYKQFLLERQFSQDAG